MDYTADRQLVSIPQELEKTIDMLTGLDERFAALRAYLEPILEPERTVTAADTNMAATEADLEQSRVIEQIRSIQLRIESFDRSLAKTVSRIQL